MKIYIEKPDAGRGWEQWDIYIGGRRNQGGIFLGDSETRNGAIDKALLIVQGSNAGDEVTEIVIPLY